MVLVLGVLACAPSGPVSEPDVVTQQQPPAAALAWLDGLDVRYTAFNLPQTLASWQRVTGQVPLDTSVADEAEIRFFTDQALREQLEALAHHSSAEVSTRAGAWLEFLNADRFENDPAVLDLSEQMLAIIEGVGDATPAALLLEALRHGDEARAQQALDDIEARSRALRPVFDARARALDAIARQLGAPDAATFVAGPQPLETLENTCRRQVERSAEDWRALLETLTHRLGHPPTFAELIPATMTWTTEANAFLDPKDLPHLTSRALAKMGFPLRDMNIVVHNDPAAASASVFGVSIPDDVRFQSNLGRPGFETVHQYFRHLGHVVHMKMVRQPHLPARQLPRDEGLNEGVGEIFASILRDPEWVRASFPHLTHAERRAFHASVRGRDALSLRLHCLQARLEQEIHAGREEQLSHRWPVLFEETFGMAPPVGPSWVFLDPGSILRPFAMRARVEGLEVRDAFMARLGDQPLLSSQAGRLLTQTLLVHGNAITLEQYLAREVLPNARSR